MGGHHRHAEGQGRCYRGVNFCIRTLLPIHKTFDSSRRPILSGDASARIEGGLEAGEAVVQSTRRKDAGAMDMFFSRRMKMAKSCTARSHANPFMNASRASSLATQREEKGSRQGRGGLTG